MFVFGRRSIQVRSIGWRCSVWVVACAVLCAWVSQIRAEEQPEPSKPAQPIPPVLPVPKASDLFAPSRTRSIDDPWGASRPEDLVIKLITFGPGDDVFNYFGHNAMVVEDRARGLDALYNFGVFAFGPEMLPKYMGGQLTFWVAETPVRATYAFYSSANRSIRVQELNLEPGRRKVLAQALSTAVLPEHREYLYDHFNNNCSTRLRDLIDVAVDGQFKRALEHPARMSYRQHIRRYAQHSPLVDFGLVFWMNRSMERPIKQWEELFLPEELEHHVASMHYRGPDGRDRSLVELSYTVFEADRAATPTWPNLGYPLFAAVGLCVGLLGLALAFWALSSGRKWVLRLFGVYNALFGLFLGLPGLVAALMWAFSGHLVTHRNENLLLSNPLTFVLFPLGIGIAFGSRHALRYARFVSYALVGGSLLLLLLKLLPFFEQDTTLPAALFLPANWLLALAHKKLGQSVWDVVPADKSPAGNAAVSGV